MAGSGKAQMQMKYGNTRGETVEEYINSLGIDNQEEKACLFRYFSDNKRNPFGNIPNYCGGEDANSGNGGRGRRGWGHRRGHGGGGKGKINDYGKWLKDHTTSTSSGRGSSSKSNLTEAFRRQQLKKLQSTTGTLKSK